MHAALERMLRLSMFSGSVKITALAPNWAQRSHKSPLSTSNTMMEPSIVFERLIEAIALDKMNLT